MTAAMVSGGVRMAASWPAVFFFQAEDGIRDYKVTGVQTCALPIFARPYIADELERGTLAEVRVRGLTLFRDSALVRRTHSGAISPALAAFIELLRKDRKSVV